MGHSLRRHRQCRILLTSDRSWPDVYPNSVGQRLVPTEVCERIIDFVAARFDSIAGWKTSRFWDDDVCETLKACSLTCRAWRPRSQLNLMRGMSVRPSIEGFKALRALLHKIPLLEENIEDLAVKGFYLGIPRFHLVPLEVYPAVPTIQSLALCGGQVYMPTVFFICMRRFDHLVQLLLQKTTFLWVHDLRRMLESLRNLKILALYIPRWLSHNPDRLLSSSPWPSRSRLRLEALEVCADAEWIMDTRSTAFLDWLSTSGAISEIHRLWLGELMLIDKNIMVAVSRMLYAIQDSPKLFRVDILFGPDVDWSLCESVP